MKTKQNIGPVGTSTASNTAHPSCYSRRSGMFFAFIVAAIACIYPAAAVIPKVTDLPSTAKSPEAAVAKDESVEYSVILPPVESCLSSVVLVVYIQHLNMLDHLDYYKLTYGPYFKDVEFYVDGTWCDPLSTDTPDLPCRGEPLDRSLLPSEVHVVDDQGGGWQMQKSFIDAVAQHKADIESKALGGFFFMSDDSIINLGQLTRAMREADSCNTVWKARILSCIDVMNDEMEKVGMLEPDKYLDQAKKFYQASSEAFRSQLLSTLGSASLYCLTAQPSFLYMPSSLALHWSSVATQMTSAGLAYMFTLTTAILGIIPASGLTVLQSSHLDEETCPAKTLTRMSFQALDGCWENWLGKVYPFETKAVDQLLGMHVIHPVDLRSRTEMLFAQTVNPPAVPPEWQVERTSGGEGRPFWCSDRVPSR